MGEYVEGESAREIREGHRSFAAVTGRHACRHGHDACGVVCQHTQCVCADTKIKTWGPSRNVNRAEMTCEIERTIRSATRTNSAQRKAKGDTAHVTDPRSSRIHFRLPTPTTEKFKLYLSYISELYLKH